jgi:hypothetical protein
MLVSKLDLGGVKRVTRLAVVAKRRKFSPELERPGAQ